MRGLIACGFWKLQRSLLQAPLHRVHFHSLVSISVFSYLTYLLLFDLRFPMILGSQSTSDLFTVITLNVVFTRVGRVGVILWLRYRAPECLLTDGYYTYKMDMWGVGCVLFEIVSLFPLFPGSSTNPLFIYLVRWIRSLTKWTCIYECLRKASIGWVVCALGRNELDQINKIHKILGTPPQALVDKMRRQVSSGLTLRITFWSACLSALDCW